MTQVIQKNISVIWSQINVHCLCGRVLQSGQTGVYSACYHQGELLALAKLRLPPFLSSAQCRSQQQTLTATELCKDKIWARKREIPLGCLNEEECKAEGRETKWNIMSVSGICIPKSACPGQSRIHQWHCHHVPSWTLTKGLLLPAFLWNRAHKGKGKSQTKSRLNWTKSTSVVKCSAGMFQPDPDPPLPPAPQLSSLVAQRDPQSIGWIT